MKVLVACGFRKEEAKIKEWFVSIFSGYFGTENVQIADVPDATKQIPEKVEEYINRADTVIGILPKREEGTSTWVIQEITIAKAKNKNVLLFVEEGINDLGMFGFHDYILFNREKLSESLKKTIEYLRSLKEKDIYSDITRYYRFIDVESRITIYSDGRGISERTSELEVLSDEFTKVIHGFGTGISTPKNTVLKKFDDIVGNVRDRFIKDQVLFWKILSPENVKENPPGFEGQWKDVEGDGFNFSLNFGNLKAGTNIKYAFGFSCKGMFPSDEKQILNGELIGGKVKTLSDWIKVSAPIENLTIILQFEYEYKLKGCPKLRVFDYTDFEIKHSYKFEKEMSLYYEKYKVHINRPVPWYKYMIEWVPEILKNKEAR